MADVLARQALGPRRSSIFMTPVRATLAHLAYAEASAENMRLTNKGISRQAFGLIPKIRQVDEWVCHAGARVVEVHPELSFAELAGAPLSTRKTTWAGAVERHRLLAGARIDLPHDLGGVGEQVAIDDVLDAAAAAWTAQRVAYGQARCLPDPPQSFSDGLAAAIWV